MTRVLRSASKKILNKEESSSKLSISKKSKAIERTDKKVLEVKDEDKKQSDIWCINSIMSKIFSYICHKELVKFNTVCKKWNYLTNPIIHKTIKFNRDWDIIRQIYDKKLIRDTVYEAEIPECISHNIKNAPYVKEFHYDYILEPRRAIEFFQAFRFISNLTIKSCDMSQDQFLGMVSPLNQLQELVISNLNIKRITYRRLYKEVVQLPSTLKKLRIDNIKLINNPELFVQTMNSHNNVVDFSIESQDNQIYLEAFHKHSPSLLNFELYNKGALIPQSLFAIFENNTQLISLKLSLQRWNSELVSHINSYLTNLEEFYLNESTSRYLTYTDFYAKFSQPTKIKKLKLKWYYLTDCSLNSILLNCSHLEELDIEGFPRESPNSIKLINLFNPTKLRKLVIDCYSPSDTMIDNLLLQCTNVKDLEIILYYEWKEVIKSVCEKCANLERLAIYPDYAICMEDSYPFHIEFYETELFTSNSICRSTLTHLTLSKLKLHNSKAEYFQNFKNLKSIKYLEQGISAIDIDMDLWPGYRALTISTGIWFGVELKKNLII